MVYVDVCPPRDASASLRCWYCHLLPCLLLCSRLGHYSLARAFAPMFVRNRRVHVMRRSPRIIRTRKSMPCQAGCQSQPLRVMRDPESLAAYDADDRPRPPLCSSSSLAYWSPLISAQIAAANRIDREYNVYMRGSGLFQLLVWHMHSIILAHPIDPISLGQCNAYA